MCRARYSRPFANCCDNMLSASVRVIGRLLFPWGRDAGLRCTDRVRICSFMAARRQADAERGGSAVVEFHPPVALVGFFARALVGQPLLAVADRKSTRLNSSHLVISYAVFCL